MTPNLILQLVIQLATNASYGIIVTFGVVPAYISIYVMRRQAFDQEDNLKRIVMRAIHACWPIFVFCAIVPVSIKFVILLAVSNLAFALALGATEPFGRTYLEHYLGYFYLVILGITGMAMALYEYYVEEKSAQVEMNSRIFLDIFKVCVRNILTSLSIIVGLGVSSVISLMTNEDAHKTLHFPQWNAIWGGRLKSWEDYKVQDAFWAGICTDGIGLTCILYSMVIPIPARIAVMVGIGLVVITIMVAIAQGMTERRNVIEFPMLFVFNGIVMGAYYVYVLFESLFTQ